MERVLQIPELVDAICSHISQYRGNDLTALARTSKIFCHPALNALWHEQTTFANILRCMPDDLWDQPIDSVLVYHLGVTRPILPSDWERPLFYMDRVRTFEAIANSDDMPSKKLFGTLGLSLPADHFFPNLRKLLWLHMDDHLFPFLPLVLAPRISNLQMDVPDNIEHLSLIPNIPRRCPLLKRASLEFHRVPPESHVQTRTVVSTFVRGLIHLENLTVEDLDKTAFEHLAALPNFKILKLQHIMQFPSFPTSNLPFLALCELHLWAGIESATAFIKAASARHLRNIDIIIRTTASVKAVSNLSTALTTHLARDAVRRISVAVHNVSALYGLPNGAIRQLFCFRNLTTLAFNFAGGFDLDDALLADLAQAWPNLKELRLLPSAPPDIPRRATLASLSVFAQHCPRLEELGMEFTAQVIPALESRAVIGKRFRRLNVGYAPILDVDAVASFILGVFPEVSVFPLTELDGVEAAQACSRQWWRVCLRIEELKKERKRIAGMESAEP
ncbi:hypothetical protein C8R43DRAFT_1109381 [Mycena crocata]|nr:hypothetical protein C8R43DRAFT_1109381 [Mycena crocata]